MDLIIGYIILRKGSNKERKHNKIRRNRRHGRGRNGRKEIRRDGKEKGFKQIRKHTTKQQNISGKTWVS